MKLSKFESGITGDWIIIAESNPDMQAEIDRLKSEKVELMEACEKSRRAFGDLILWGGIPHEGNIKKLTSLLDGLIEKAQAGVNHEPIS